MTFLAIIVAGSRAHGFVQHWKNLVPHGVPVWLYPLLIPLEIIGMLVRPFALTMRLAANMTGGHIAMLAILSFVFIFSELFGQAAAMGVGLDAVAARRRRSVGARADRDSGAGIRVHAADGRVHRHGHSRSSLSAPVRKDRPYRTERPVARTGPTEGRTKWNLQFAYMGAGIGVGLAVIGAGLGIGRLAAGAAEAIGRQPSASAQITGAVQLPLFLLEGVAVLAVVCGLMIVFK